MILLVSFLALLAGDVAGQGSTTLIVVVAKLAAVLFFVGANAFFVGSEFALVSVRRTRLEARAAAGSRRARAALRLIGDPTSFISATQTRDHNRLSGARLVGESVVAGLLQPIAFRIASTGARVMSRTF